MKFKKIVFKLFIMTSSVFILFLVIQVLFQSVFLEKLYIRNKIDTTRENIQTFVENYEVGDWEYKETIENMNNFINKTNASIIITNEEGKLKYDENINSSLTVRTELGDIYQIDLLDLENLIYNNANIDLKYLAENEFEKNFHPKVGEFISLNGKLYLEDKFLEINSVDYKGVVYTDDFSTDFMDDAKYSIKSIEGEIIYIYDPVETKELFSYKDEILLKEVNLFFFDYGSRSANINDELLIDEYDYYWLEDKSSNANNIIFYKSLLLNGEKQYVFVMVSLQAIDEAINFISSYLVYMVIFAVLLIFILSFVYSKMIAKPLINMNNVAMKMAQLDFSAKCSIHGEDELGSLSKSLNTLSDNLESSLTDLRETNSKLVDDIEREKKQEIIRKEFVANVSHELKTPLGIMKGFAYGIKDGIFEDKKDYYLNVIIDEIEKMNVLILDMLEISKFEAQGYVLSNDMFFIDELLEKVKSRFDPMFCENKLRIKMELNSYEVCGDIVKIEQVLMNLFSNAIRYSSSNEMILVELKKEDSNIRVSISNSGSYISDEDILKIWDRFYRVEKSRNKTHGGTGLGLLIVKNILNLHESEYGVQNTENGVEFYFTLKEL